MAALTEPEEEDQIQIGQNNPREGQDADGPEAAILAPYLWVSFTSERKNLLNHQYFLSFCSMQLNPKSNWQTEI